MKIGVISDTHIPEQAKEIPKEILLAFQGVNMVVHAGDLVDLIVLDKLRAVCKDVLAVRGNMDSYEARKSLPEKNVLKIGNFKIAVTHGYGHPLRLISLVSEIFKEDNVDLIIFGHSHCASNEKIGDVLYFNPGSPTDKISAPYNTYGIIDINDKIEAKIIRI